VLQWQGTGRNTIHVLAPAKLNLTLEVGQPRRDGYHPLASVMIPLSLADELILTKRPDNEITLDIVMADPFAVPLEVTDDNLVLQAARFVQEYAAQHMGTQCGVSIKLVKRIPVAAGLGGGSADAAAVMLGLNRLWGLNIKRSTLAKLGVELGADIPFCIRSRAGLVEGIGEQYTPLAGVPKLAFVLVNPRKPLSTAHVFQEFDAIGKPSQPGERTMRMIRALYKGLPAPIAEAFYNDLAYPAQHIVPWIEEAEHKLQNFGALGTIVAGSGPTVAALARNEKHAEDIAAQCAKNERNGASSWWVWSGVGGTIEYNLCRSSMQYEQLSLGKQK